MPGRDALRRRSSFTKMDKLMEQTDAWFYTSPELALSVDTFAAKHADCFVPQAGGGDRSGEGEEGWFLFQELRSSVDSQQRLGAAAHEAKRLFEIFVGLFEGELAVWLSSQGVSSAEFQEVFGISQREEERSGRHYYRWHEVGSYSVWFAMMHAVRTAEGGDTPCTHLRNHIRRLSQEAKATHRRSRALRPLLDLWRPASLEELDKALADPRCPSAVPPRVMAKMRAQWRHHLSAPEAGGDGVYRAPKMDPWRLSRYLAAVADSMDEATFSSFVTFLHAFVDALPRDDAAALRHGVAPLFKRLDHEFTGEVEWDDVALLLRKAGGFDTKAERKVIAQWAGALQDGPESYRPLTLDEFIRLLQELVQGGGDAGGGAEVVGKLAAKLDETAEVLFCKD
eukprot:Hpha_TRINITY_DN31717_c0_g1::TRINITY_DN31717_c0_g1_i1::g.116430::m.116430